MLGFSSIDQEGVLLWSGDPHSQAGHDSFLAWLTPRVGQFLAAPVEFTLQIKGNLGESLAFFLGVSAAFPDHRPFAANANEPLKPISKPDIDIVWIFFADQPSGDRAIVQEIKTTGDDSLGISARLSADYRKLLGEDPKVTLHTRLIAIKNEVEFKLRRPDLRPRISRLATDRAQTMRQVSLVPTLVHDENADAPAAKLSAVRTAITSQGWAERSIHPWSIALSDIDGRLLRISLGKS